MSSNELTPALQQRLSLYDSQRNFQPESWLESRTKAIYDYIKHGLTSFVVSISGGVDSAVVFKTLVHVCKTYKECGLHIYALAQPIQSTESIQNRAYELFNATVDENPELKDNLHLLTINHTNAHQQLCSTIAKEMGIVGLSEWTKGMAKSYMRTPPAYIVATQTKGLVVGTGNLDEDGYLFYFCKFGDGAVDMSFIHDLHKCDVFTVGRWLKVPESILVAPPSADLLPNQTDENEMNCSYDAVRLVTCSIYDNEMKESHDTWMTTLSEEDVKLYMSLKEKVDAIHNRGLHKADLNPVLIGKQNNASSTDSYTIYICVLLILILCVLLILLLCILIGCGIHTLL